MKIITITELRREAHLYIRDILKDKEPIGITQLKIPVGVMTRPSQKSKYTIIKEKTFTRTQLKHETAKVLQTLDIKKYDCVNIMLRKKLNVVILNVKFFDGEVLNV
jgi:PHD/YefM family antitoxin component YafN of YafNO toxin-antitoxin module